MVLNEDHPAVAPDKLRSATGKLATMSAPDDSTLVISFDTPAPLTPVELASWVNASAFWPAWMAPKHYLKPHHLKYNPGLEDDWADAFERKRDFQQNSNCPTMTGWRLKSVKEGDNLIWERNPYYYAVTRDGHQLPYIDTLTVSVVQDPEVGKLKIHEGGVDYVHGPFASIALADVSGLKRSETRSQLKVLFWASGSGEGSLFFFNFNYRDPKVRSLIEKPKFRQALSHAVDRDEVQRAVFFDTGEQTTGTYSPKTSDFLVSKDGRRVYKQWRDSYRDYSPEKAKALLDEIGVVDQDGDGKRELPDGSKLVIRLDEPAEAPDTSIHMSNLLQRYWEALGLDVQQNPVPPAAWETKWQAGELMTYTSWPNPALGVHEMMADPHLLVPIEPLGAQLWAPLYSNYHAIRNTPEAHRVEGTDPYERTPPSMKPSDGGPVDRLWKLYDRAKTEPDTMKRYSIVREMTKIHVDEGPFFMGVVADYPQIELAHHDLANVPKGSNLKAGGSVNSWIHPTPAVYDPESYFWRSPKEHS